MTSQTTTMIDILKGKVPVSITMYKAPISGHDLLRSLWFNFRLTNKDMLKRYPDIDPALKFFKENPGYKQLVKNRNGLVSVFEKTFLQEHHDYLLILGDDSEKGFTFEIKRTGDTGFMIYYIGYTSTFGKIFYDWFHKCILEDHDKIPYEDIESNIVVYTFLDLSTYNFKNTEA